MCSALTGPADRSMLNRREQDIEKGEEESETDILFRRAHDTDVGTREVFPEVIHERAGSLRHSVAHDEGRILVL